MKLDPSLLERCRSAQQKTYQGLRAVAQALRAGMSEVEAAALLRQELCDRGAQGFFHEPIVWFGGRTAFEGIEARLDALPTQNQIAAGQAFILDAAPIFDGCTADVSFSGSLAAPSPPPGTSLLASLRKEIPGWINSGSTGRQVAQKVAAFAAAQGFESKQDGYLFGALGHRVFRHRPNPFLRRSAFGLGLSSAFQLFGRAALSRLPGTGCEWPFWNDSKFAENPPRFGLWSVEPHIAKDNHGLKWEELIVIDEDGARWLEERSPFDPDGFANAR